MTHKKPNLLESETWSQLPLHIQLYIVWLIFKSAHWPYLADQGLKRIYRVDLWLFPPLAFISTYIATLRYFPAHIMKEEAVLATSFMAMTLTLFLIRPPKLVQNMEGK